MTTLPLLPMGPDAPWLAPLAGYSDLPFRLLCREYGAAVACTEMISAKGILYNNSGTQTLLKTCPADNPLVVQIFGAEPGIMEWAAAWLLERGHRFLDINAGCAVPKVTKTGAGAGLLRSGEDCQRLAEIVRRLSALTGPGHVGVKLRLGWDADIFLDLGQALEQAGAGWLTLHPRTARQGFSGRARWQAIADLRKAVSIPVLASGDLLTAEDARQCVDQTGASGVLFARGAMRHPAVFREWRSLMAGEPPPPFGPAELIAVVRRHGELAREYGNAHTAFLKMRTFIPRYLKDLAHARALRRQVVSCKSWQELENLLDAALEMEGMAVPDKETEVSS